MLINVSIIYIGIYLDARSEWKLRRIWFGINWRRRSR